MSINNSYKMQVIESDGTTTRYNFECFINSKEDLKIKVIDTNGNIKELEYGNDYNVENKFDYYNGGYFNLAKPQTRGYTIVIYRETPINQQINFMSLQTISPMNLTKMFDKLTIIAQEINEQFFRAVKFDFTDISLIDQDKPLNESNIKNLNPELNKDKIVAITLKYNETSNKWELYTSTTNPDETREEGTETSYGVFKIATIEEAKIGANDNKVITPLKLKTTLDDRQATTEEVETEQDIKKYVNPKQVGYCIDNRQATDAEINTAQDIKKYINPKQINDYLDDRQATNSEVETEEDIRKYVNPKQLSNYLDNRQATDAEISTAEDIKKYINPKQINDYLDNRQATNSEVETEEDIRKYVNPKQLSNYLDNRQATNEEISTAEDIKKYINPKQINDYLDDRQATTEEVTTEQDIKKYINPSQLSNYLDNRQATDEEIEIGEDIKKYINPNQLSNYLDNRQATAEEIETEQDIKKYVNPKQLKDYLDARKATAEEAIDGTNDNKFMTPSKTIDSISNYISETLDIDSICRYLEGKSYLKGDLCFHQQEDTSTNIYYSKVDNNQGHIPVGNTEDEFWQQISGDFNALEANMAKVDGSNLTHGFQMVNEFNVTNGDTQIRINNLNANGSSSRHLIIIKDLKTAQKTSGNYPYIRLGTETSVEPSNYYSYTNLRIFSKLVSGYMQTEVNAEGNVGANEFRLKYDDDDAVTTNETFIIELGRLSGNRIFMTVRRYMLPVTTYSAFFNCNCYFNNYYGGMRSLIFTSKLASSNPFTGGKVSVYKIF